MQNRTIPTVSVVMPAYNAEKYLREAIESVLSQTFTDFEFIIINDGSTDNTKDIILSYEDLRIVYLENERNSGICVTLNKGLDVARGKYIARMDSDDISLPERLAKQVEYMESHLEIGALGTDFEVFGEDIKSYVFTQLHTPEECKAGLLFNSCFAHPSVMIRRSVLDINGLRYKDEYRGLEDYELWWQISKYSKLNNLSTPLLKYRHHKGQETRNVGQKVKSSFESFISIRMKDINANLTQSDLKLLHAYSIGDFESIASDNFEKFLALFRHLLEAYSEMNDRKLYKTAKLTIAKAITYTINKTTLQAYAQRHYNNAWKKGLFPILWYLKVTYHNLYK